MKTKSKRTEYKCDHCKEVCYYLDDWSEADALKEMEENFPGEKREDCAQICDECYKKFKGWMDELSPDEIIEMESERLKEEIERENN